jgi:hypothetical protein
MTRSLATILVLATAACGADGSHDRDRIDERRAVDPVPGSGDALDPDAGSCVAPEDSFGLAVIQLTGAITGRRSDDAHFGLTPDSTSFYLMITEPEIGHFEMVFERPGQPGYPKPGTHDLGAEGAGPGSGFTARLQLFLDAEYVGFALREGRLTIETADPTGACGSLDVVWASRETDSLTLHTTGEFQAVLNRYSPPPGR